MSSQCQTYACGNCEGCNNCNTSCNVTCNSCQGCNTKQNFCKTNQYAATYVTISDNLKPSQYSDITPTIFNNIKDILISINEYGSLPTDKTKRNPNPSGLNTYNMSQFEQVDTTDFNILANKINSNLAVSQYDSVTQQKFIEFVDYLKNNYQIETARCNNCNTAANTTCASCQGCNSAQSCGNGGNTNYTCTDKCEQLCACCNHGQHMWESIC